MPNVTLSTAVGNDNGPRVAFASFTSFQDRTLTAVEGLLLHRNAWNLTSGPQIECDGLMTMMVYPRARSLGGHIKPDPWSSSMKPTKQDGRVCNSRFRHSDYHRFSLDISFTVNGSEGHETDLMYLHNLTKLCTVSWELGPTHFYPMTIRRMYRWGPGVKFHFFWISLSSSPCCSPSSLAQGLRSRCQGDPLSFLRPSSGTVSRLSSSGRVR